MTTLEDDLEDFERYEKEAALRAHKQNWRRHVVNTRTSRNRYDNDLYRWELMAPLVAVAVVVAVISGIATPVISVEHGIWGLIPGGSLAVLIVGGVWFHVTCWLWKSTLRELEAALDDR